MGNKLFGETFDEHVLKVGDTRFWAERGLIHCDGPKGYKILTVYVFLKHVQGVCNMLGNTSARTDTVRDASLRREYLNITDAAHAIAQRAREQGTPDDPGACREYVRRRAKTICADNDSVRF